MAYYRLANTRELWQRRWKSGQPFNRRSGRCARGGALGSVPGLPAGQLALVLAPTPHFPGVGAFPDSGSTAWRNPQQCRQSDFVFSMRVNAFVKATPSEAARNSFTWEGDSAVPPAPPEAPTARSRPLWTQICGRCVKSLPISIGGPTCLAIESRCATQSLPVPVPLVAA
jgi:hypothetical protein